MPAMDFRLILLASFEGPGYPERMSSLVLDENETRKSKHLSLQLMVRPRFVHGKSYGPNVSRISNSGASMVMETFLSDVTDSVV